MNDPDNKEEYPPLLHRDDIPMDIAADMVERLKEIHGNDDLKVRFIGDLTDKEKDKLPKEMMESIKQLHEHLVKCFIEGLCHVCETKFPGEWPPKEGDDWDWKEWTYYDTESKDQPPALVCPKCEEEDDGKTKYVDYNL